MFANLDRLFMKNIIICAITTLAFLSACKKQYQSVVTPSFDVTTDSLVYKVNEPITFNVSGNADRVTFYSGDFGHNYDFKNRVTVDAKAQIQFKTVRQFGAGVGIRDSTLRLKISKDYSGEPNAVDIAKAKWIDVTDRAILNLGTGAVANVADRTPSGVVDISDIAKGDSAIYIAFQYLEKQTNQTKRAWNIFDFTIDNLLPDNSLINVAKWGDLVFTPVNIQNTSRAWYVNATTSIPQSLMWGGAANLPDTEDWIVAKPIYVNRVHRDIGVSIRNNPKALLEDYTFSGFSKPGIYTVVFEAINATQWDNKQVLKKITLTIK